MFVIMQCWENVNRNPQSKDLPTSEKIGLSFFKVFVLTVVFGLFHGLLLFPSLLATIGPQNRSKTDSSTTSTSTTPISLLGAGKDNRTFLSDEAGTKKDTLDSAW